MIELAKINKADFMKIRTFIMPVAMFALGGLVVAVVFLEKVIPEINNLITSDVQYIQLDGDDKPYNYHEFLSEVHMARAYLWNPLYFYKKDLGYRMLAGLAENGGYTPAAISLNSYHGNRMIHFVLKGDFEKTKEHFDKSYYWSKLAAKQGDERLLMMFVKNNPTTLPQPNLEEDLEVLEGWARKSSLHTAAWGVANYYKEHGNEEKAAEFFKIQEERLNNPLPEPACMTITPWRGL